MSRRPRWEIVVIGSGFAGSVLARILARQGFDVLLIERERHPRLALGESSTPLAAIALERLAVRYGLPDLHALATHGRWSDCYPELRRGLKRGFTFYSHAAGRPYRNGASNEHRMLVAASPNDRLADAHWLRADVDAFLARRAAEAGVAFLESTEVVGAAEEPGGIELALATTGDVGDGSEPASTRPVFADFVIDASGPGGVLARAFGLAGKAGDRRESALVAAHFQGLEPFSQVARRAGATLPEGPYPEDRAAVHHLLDRAWMYQLPFDHGVTSAGFVLDAETLAGPEPVDGERAFRTVLTRYPSLVEQFRDAEPISPWIVRRRLAHRLPRAVGERWALTPGGFAFSDPLFSTGIAWSLVGVERLAMLFEDGGPPSAGGLQRYERLLALEADHVEALIAAAHRGLPRLSRFGPAALLYFAAASFCETRQRLTWEVDDPAWWGFLGADDPVLVSAVGELGRRLGGTAGSAPDPGLWSWLLEAVEPRDVAGLAHPPAPNLYPADLATVIEGAPKLGLAPEQARAALEELGLL